MRTDKKVQPNLIIAAIIVVGFLIGILSRFTEIPNFTALGAIALFSGAYFAKKKMSFAFPLLLLFVSNFILMMANGMDVSYFFYKAMIFVFAGYALIIALGRVISKNRNPLFIAGASIAGSVIFFLVSNFGVWITHTGTLPTNTLMQVYIDGLPFLRPMLISDFAANAVFFTAAYFLIERNYTLATVNEK